MFFCFLLWCDKEVLVSFVSTNLVLILLQFDVSHTLFKYINDLALFALRHVYLNLTTVDVCRDLGKTYVFWCNSRKWHPVYMLNSGEKDSFSENSEKMFLEFDYEHCRNLRAWLLKEARIHVKFCLYIYIYIYIYYIVYKYILYNIYYIYSSGHRPFSRESILNWKFTFFNLILI